MKAFLLIAVVALMSSCEPKNYRVELTYCDSRPKDTVTVKSSTGDPFTRRSIQTYKRAVPEFKDYVNVCDVRTLGEVKGGDNGF